MAILYQHFGKQINTELKKEATYLVYGVEENGIDYLKQIKEKDDRITYIAEDGTVLYDSRRDADILKNHGNRKEVREALSKGEGADVRKSETVGKDMYYYALLLNDGTVLRVSKSIDNLASTAVSLMPVMGILAVLTILLGVALASFAIFDISGYGNMGVGWTLDGINFGGGLLRMLFPSPWACFCRATSSLSR